SANSSSPYWARRDRRPFFMAIPQTKADTSPPLLNRRRRSVNEKRGGPPDGGRNRAGRSNGGGRGLLTPIVRARRVMGVSRRTPFGRRQAAKGSSRVLRKFGRSRAGHRAGLCPEQRHEPLHAE